MEYIRIESLVLDEKLDSVVNLVCARSMPVFVCGKHGDVESKVTVGGKEFCGVCVREAVEKFIRDMDGCTAWEHDATTTTA